MTTGITEISKHPLTDLLRTERLPHIWCPGCGLGIILGTLLRSIQKSGLDLDKTVFISGIGCTGRAAGYVRLDSFHVTHGRALPFATGLKLASPELKVILFSGDGDLTAIGGNHFIHAARRNIDLTVVCVNNFTYGMTGGQFGPTTPQTARSTTTVTGNIERPFNIPSLAAVSGATYIARWTAGHIPQMERAFGEAIAKKGFSLVEVISPCPTYFGRMNKYATGLDMMKFYRQNNIIKNDANLAEIDIKLNEKITIGKFVDIERPYIPGGLDGTDDK